MDAAAALRGARCWATGPAAAPLSACQKANSLVTAERPAGVAAPTTTAAPMAPILAHLARADADSGPSDLAEKNIFHATNDPRPIAPPLRPRRRTTPKVRSNAPVGGASSRAADRSAFAKTFASRSRSVGVSFMVFLPEIGLEAALA